MRKPRGMRTWLAAKLGKCVGLIQRPGTPIAGGLCGKTCTRTRNFLGDPIQHALPSCHPPALVGNSKSGSERVVSMRPTSRYASDLYISWHSGNLYIMNKKNYIMSICNVQVKIIRAELRSSVEKKMLH